MPLPKLRSNSLLGSSFFIFIIRFFPSLANLVVLLYYSRQLDKITYGAYQNFWIQLNIIAPIAYFGINALLMTYPPGAIVKLAKTISNKQYFVYLLWLIMLSVGFAALQYSNLSIGFLLPFLFMATFATGVIIESLLVAFKNFRILALVNFLYAALYIAIHKLVLDAGYSHFHLFLSLLLLNCLRLAFSLYILMGNIKRVRDEHTALRPVKDIRTLWMHLGFFDVLQAFSMWVDKFLVSVLLTASLSAIYFNGTQNVPFLALITGAAGNAVLIQMARVKEADEGAQLRYLVHLSAKHLSNIVFPLFFFLVFFCHEVFHCFLPGYEAAVPIFFISLFLLPLRTYSFLTVFQKLHKGYISNIGAVGELILACLLMYPLYKWLGLPGIMLSFVISTYAQVVFYFYHISKLLQTGIHNLIPFANWAIKSSIFFVLFMILHYFLTSFFELNISLAIGMAVMVITIAAALFIETTLQKNGGNAE